jgi:hypothetical protein
MVSLVSKKKLKQYFVFAYINLDLLCDMLGWRGLPGVLQFQWIRRWCWGYTCYQRSKFKPREGYRVCFIQNKGKLRISLFFLDYCGPFDQPTSLCNVHELLISIHLCMLCNLANHFWKAVVLVTMPSPDDPFLNYTSGIYKGKYNSKASFLNYISALKYQL